MQKKRKISLVRKRAFDESWKLVLEKYFWECLDFYFPEISKQIDKTKGYSFLDQELQQITPKSKSKKRRVDKLAEVYLQDNKEIWVLIHIEVQTYKEEEFAMRMYSYHYRIWDKYQKPIASLAILADNYEKFKPEKFELCAFGEKFVEFKFKIAKLLDWEKKEDELKNNKNVFAIVTLASLKAYQENYTTRAEWKYELTKMLYEKGYKEKEIMSLYQFLDGIMVLPEDMEIEYNDKIIELEEEKKMAYVTTAERIGIKKGRKEGIIEGAIKGIEGMLDIKFGDLGLSFMPQILEINDVDKLTQVLKAIKQAKDQSEFGKMLEKIGKEK